MCVTEKSDKKFLKRDMNAKKEWPISEKDGLVEYALGGLECCFLKINDIFKTLDDILLAIGPNSYAYPYIDQRYKSVKKIFERQERIYGIDNDLHIVILNVISSK